MTFATSYAVRGKSPIAAAMTPWASSRPAPREAEPPEAEPPAPEPTPPAAEPRAARLTDRLDAKIAEIEAAGYRICWLEVGRDELLTLFREGGDQAVLLDPDPARDCGWYRAYEVRYTGRELIWILIEGEVPGGEKSIHILD